MEERIFSLGIVLPERFFWRRADVAKEEGSEADYNTSEYLTDRVVGLLNKTFVNGDIPTVEDVQEMLLLRF